MLLRIFENTVPEKVQLVHTDHKLMTNDKIRETEYNDFSICQMSHILMFGKLSSSDAILHQGQVLV